MIDRDIDYMVNAQCQPHSGLTSIGMIIDRRIRCIAPEHGTKGSGAMHLLTRGNRNTIDVWPLCG